MKHVVIRTKRIFIGEVLEEKPKSVKVRTRNNTIWVDRKNIVPKRELEKAIEEWNNLQSLSES